jgi:aldehyde dehydrogenase (NAD+)
MVTYPNYINGKFLHSDNNYFESRNPINQEDIVGAFPDSNNVDLWRAIDAAKNAYPAWKRMGLVKRAECFWEFAKLIDENKKLLARIVCRESGKQINEAMADVVEMLHMCQYDFAKAFEGVAGKLFDDEISEKMCMETYHPRGIVGCISPWNFPMAIPLWQMGLALAYGNVVILKPSEETPLCAQQLMVLMNRAGFPPGTIQMLHGTGENIGWQLVKHPEVNSVIFTGSYDVGAKIKLETARHYNKFCTIETGSKSAVIVLDDADMNRLAVPSALASAFKTAGQRCVSGGRIIVDKKRLPEFIDKFVSLAEQIKVGDPFDENSYYGPMINPVGVEKGKRFNQMAREEGFEILLDRNNEEPPTQNGHWLMPFVYTGEWKNDSCVLTNEAFSPHVAIIPAEDMEDALRIYNDTRYGLSVSVISEDFRKAKHCQENAEAGMFYWNLPCIGAGVRMPFGGVKASGNLIPSAAGIMPAITHTTAATFNMSNEITMAQGLSIKT